MARMSVDDAVLRDPRITHLSQLAGWPRRETLGCLIEIWAICYDRIDHALGPALIDMVAGRKGFADLMLEAELATRMPSGKLRIAGAKERIGYLSQLKQFGREGGLKSAERRRNESKGSIKPPVKPPHNPIPIPPVPDSASVPDPPPPPAHSDSAPPPAGEKSKRPLPENWTPERSKATLEAEAKARNRGVNLEDELEKLRDWCKTNNAKKADWDATWRNWTRNAKPSGPQRQQQWTVQDQLDRVRMLEEQERAKENS